MASNDKLTPLTVIIDIPDGENISIDDYKQEILDILKKHNIKWANQTGIFDKIKMDDSHSTSFQKKSDYTILLKFPYSFKLTRNIKQDIDKVIEEYIQKKFLKNSYNKMIPASLKKVNVAVSPKAEECKEIRYKYTFKIETDESINTLVDYIKNNDIKNSNTTLSKILKEKINTRLNNFIKIK